MEKISVIIKTNNSGNTLCDTLESIKEFDEIIIIDFNSTDDTIDIAKEYKSKVIFSNLNEENNMLNQAIEEITNSWILFIEPDEILNKNLISDIKNYIENNKKNKNALSFFIKRFYLNKEIKLAKTKELRLFKKSSIEYNNKPILKEGKVYHYKKNCILKYKENDIKKELVEILEKNKTIAKKINRKNICPVVSSLFIFLYFYILKGGIFEGLNGYIYSFNKMIEKYSLELMIKEKTFKEKNNDF